MITAVKDGSIAASNVFANSEYPGGIPKVNDDGDRVGDSVPTNAIKMEATKSLPEQLATRSKKVVDMFDTGFNGVRYNPNDATALGNIGDKIGDYGEATQLRFSLVVHSYSRCGQGRLRRRRRKCHGQIQRATSSLHKPCTGRSTTPHSRRRWRIRDEIFQLE